MQIIENIILGLIQGLTEFIPISSSGHLVVAQNFFSGASDHLFLEFINIGTLLALLIYFRVRILAAAKDVLVNRNYRLAANILITAIPAGVVGLVFADFIKENGFFGSITTVIVSLVVVGIVMIAIDKIAARPQIDDGEKLSSGRALLIGLVQILALIPGVSRSGSTIVAGRLAGLTSAAAAEYSFLVSIPIMMGVTLKLFMTDQTYLATNFGLVVVSNLAAFVAGLFAVSFLMKYLTKHGLAIFGWYRLGLAAVLTLVLLVQ